MCTQRNACEMSIVHVANVAGWVTSGVSYTELQCLPHTAKLAIAVQCETMHGVSTPPRVLYFNYGVRR